MRQHQTPCMTVPRARAQPVVTGAGAHASLMDALAVAEFLAAFGDLCEAPVLSLAAVQRAAARPLGAGGALGALYAALLRCVLLEKVSLAREQL